MRVAIERTGGFVVLAESFAHEVFRASFSRMFCQEGDAALGLASSAVFEARALPFLFSLVVPAIFTIVVVTVAIIINSTTTKTMFTIY